ncbi:hypothetical protein F4782DRAFT_533529 [Xylaria castorea]|nr:hypothetical protein F4782DRAFT_533529 [Xylaria castorea]
MQYLVIFISLLQGATATSVKQRQATQAEVTSFAARTNLYGDGASIVYDLEIPGLVDTHCAYSDTTSGSKLPALQLTFCDDSAVTWYFHQDPVRGGHYRINIIYTPVTGPATGYFHDWQESDFPEMLVDSASETAYVGEPKFFLDISS